MAQSQCLTCQHIVKAKVHHCPMCNGGMKILHANNPDKQCPRCALPLTIKHYRKFELDHCKQCEGLWLEPEEFAVLTSEFDVYRDDKSQPIYTRPGLKKSENYLSCANCRKVMSRRNFKSISGVLIDACIHCGVWLDKGELASIRSFIASGGLDRAQDGKIDHQTLKLEALNDRVSDLELMEKMLNKFDLKRVLFRGF